MTAISIRLSDSNSNTQNEYFDLSNFFGDVMEILGIPVMNELSEQFEKDANSNFILSGDIGGGWTIRTPLEVEVKVTEEGEFLVSDREFEIYGEGEDIEKAINDYYIALKDHYTIYQEYLEANDDPATRKAFHYLKSYISSPNSS